MKICENQKLLICFDMNGVLIDDEKIHYLAFQYALKIYNCNEFQYEDYQKYFAGKTDVEGFKSFFYNRIEHVDIDNLQKIKTKKYKSYFNIEDKHLLNEVIIDETKKIILHLKEKNYKLALVTGSIKEEVDLVLNILNLSKNTFELILTKENYKKSKPDPESYLFACQQLGFSPEYTVVIEDAPSGVDSALNAGCYCIAITTTHNNQQLKKANLIVDIKELESSLNNVLNSLIKDQI